MSALLGLFGGIWGKLAVAGGIVLAVGAVLLGAKSAGRSAAVAEAAERAIKNARTRNEIEDSLRAANHDTRERLRKKWTR